MSTKNTYVHDKRIYSWSIEGSRKVFQRVFIIGNYGDNLPAYLELIAEAKRDFPFLKDKDITLSKVTASSSILHHILITFELPAGSKVCGYSLYKDLNFNY